VKNAKIPIIAEENYLKSSWCGETLDGIGRQKYEIVTPDDVKNFAKSSVVPIIGTTNHFLKKSITVCIENNLRPIVVGTETANVDSRISTIKTNRKAAVTSLLKYFKSAGRNSTALLGVNRYSTIDNEKKDAFTEAYSALYKKDAQKNIYYSKTNAEDCVNSLLSDISSYNGVICSNDYFAVLFMSKARKAGIKIPEDVFTAGYGNSFICENITPAVTSVAPKYREMGTQTRKAYYYLSDNPSVSSVSILVDYDIIVRESTLNIKFENDSSIISNNFEPCTHTIFDDGKIRGIIGLDAVFGSSDTSLTMILKGIANDVSYSALAEKLYLSDSAFRYKLNKIFALTHTKSKNELKDLLNDLNLKNN